VNEVHDFGALTIGTTFF